MQIRLGADRFGDVFTITKSEWETIHAVMREAYRMPYTPERLQVFLGVPVRNEAMPRAMQNLLSLCQAYHDFGGQWRDAVFPRLAESGRAVLTFAVGASADYERLQKACTTYQDCPEVVAPLARQEFLAQVRALHRQVAALAAQAKATSDMVSAFSTRLEIAASSNAEDDPELQRELENWTRTGSGSRRQMKSMALRQERPEISKIRELLAVIARGGSGITMVDRLHAAVSLAAQVVDIMQGAAMGLSDDFAHLEQLLGVDLPQADPLLADLSLEEAALSWARLADEARDFLSALAAAPFGDWDYPLPAGEYLIRAEHSGQVFDVKEGSRADVAHVIQYPWHGGNNQRWRFEPLPDGCYRISAVHSGKCLDIEGGSHDARARLIQYGWHGGDNQRFRLLPAAPGWFVMQAKHSGQVLDVKGASHDPVAQVIQYPLHGLPNQRFRIQHL